MGVKMYIWQSPTGTWFALCPSLEAGGRGPTREKALCELKSEIAHDLEMLFNEKIEIINSPAPAKE